MGSERLEDITRHTVPGSDITNGWLKAWNKYRGIALDAEDLFDVQLGRLIITPDVIQMHL